MSLPRIDVVGLGPAGPELTTVGAVEALTSGRRAFLRTHRHPAAAPFASLPSFDDHYEAAESFADLYPAIVEDLVARATDHGHVVWAVPGSPFVLERTVELVLADPRVDVTVAPAMSFLDLTWARLGIDPIEAGVTLVDGHRFAVAAAGVTGALLIGHAHANSVLSEIKLAFDDDEPERALIVQRLGLPDERITEVAWADLDRSVDADHLTSVFVPEVRAPVAAELVRFDLLVRTLREQCPWDREQTHQSLARYALEETHEVLEAIGRLDVEAGSGYDALEEELGDLLFQVFFHATIATEAGQFTVGDVARGIHDKLERRHPHVFGTVDVGDDQAQVVANWEQIKRQEKGRSSIFDGIPKTLPGLAYAQKVLSKSRRVGFTPTPSDPREELLDQLLADGTALGQVLFDIARRADALGLDAEFALRDASERHRARAVAHERLDATPDQTSTSPSER